MLPDEDPTTPIGHKQYRRQLSHIDEDHAKQRKGSYRKTNAENEVCIVLYLVQPPATLFVGPTQKSAKTRSSQRNLRRNETGHVHRAFPNPKPSRGTSKEKMDGTPRDRQTRPNRTEGRKDARHKKLNIRHIRAPHKRLQKNEDHRRPQVEAAIGNHGRTDYHRPSEREKSYPHSKLTIDKNRRQKNL